MHVQQHVCDRGPERMVDLSITIGPSKQENLSNKHDDQEIDIKQENLDVK